MSGVPAGRPALRDFAADDSGAVVSADFMLTFPVFITVFMMALQLGLVLAAQFVVEQAAFAACRSAVVWIPADLSQDGGDERNTMDGGVKKKHAREAAATVCAGISPRAGDWLPDVLAKLGAGAGDVIGGAADRAVEWGREVQTGPGRFDDWTGRFASWGAGRVSDWAGSLEQSGHDFGEWGSRVAVAAFLTNVSFPEGDGKNEKTRWGEHEDVTAVVDHDFVLRLPIARALLGHRLVPGLPGSPFVISLRATVTLTNQGRPHGARLR